MTTLDRALLEASWRSWLSAEGPRAGPAWLQWVWTLLFAAILAAAFTVLGFVVFGGGPGLDTPARWASWYGRNLVVCVTVAGLIHLMFDLSLPWARRRLGRWAGWQRSVYFGGVPMVGMLAGWPLGVSLAGFDLGQWLLDRDGLRTVGGSVLISAVVGFLLHHWFASKARTQEALTEAEQTTAR